METTREGFKVERTITETTERKQNAIVLAQNEEEVQEKLKKGDVYFDSRNRDPGSDMKDVLKVVEKISITKQGE